MTTIPAGVFVLGDGRGRGQTDERPARIVSIAYAFALGRKEVTFDEWDACTADGACRHRPQDMGWGRGDRPVVNVSFSDAQTYLKWLSAKTGRTYRLPSEAEWEYAARAGSTQDFTFGDDRAQICAYANVADAASAYEWRNPDCADPFAARTAPTGSFKPNAFGLFDMHGNVWEWVEDCWHDGYATSPTDGSAWVVGCTRSDHVLRGGSFSVSVRTEAHTASRTCTCRPPARSFSCSDAACAQAGHSSAAAAQIVFLAKSRGSQAAPDRGRLIRELIPGVLNHPGEPVSPGLFFGGQLPGCDYPSSPE
jgi:formylglycine-generating enzyme required for sulfatase activity